MSAEWRVKTFERTYGDAVSRLAWHASVPVVLDPDLIHYLRINFFLDGIPQLPFTAEADVLLSPICEELGDGLYSIDPDVRTILVRKLSEAYGQKRLREIALLLWSYGERRAPWAGRPKLERAQQLTALSFLSAERAIDWLDRAKQDMGEFPDENREWFTAMNREVEIGTTTTSTAHDVSVDGARGESTRDLVSAELRRELVSALLRIRGVETIIGHNMLLSDRDLSLIRNEDTAHRGLDLLVAQLARRDGAELLGLIDNAVAYIQGSETAQHLLALRGRIEASFEEATQDEQPSSVGAPFNHLTEDELYDLFRAASSAGLDGGGFRVSLLGGIDGAVAGALSLHVAPDTQLLSDLHALNRVKQSHSGKVPLRKWLQNALALAGARQEAEVFRHALANIGTPTDERAELDEIEQPEVAPRLSDDEILLIYETAIRVGFVNSRKALLSGIHPEFAASLSYGENGRAQLLNDLNEINRASILVDGTVPLESWLENAVALAPKRERAVFQLALENLRAKTSSVTVRDLPADPTSTETFESRGRRFSSERLHEIHRAIIHAGLADDRASLLAGIAPALVAQLPSGSSPSGQILMDLNTIEQWGQRTDDYVALRTWLINAMHLSGARQESVIFRLALEDIAR